VNASGSAPPYPFCLYASTGYDSVHGNLSEI
jgi:hypothetical protein